MKGMTVIVKTISGWVKVLMVMFGLYITLTGHLSPGGGFAGGVIFASAYILLMLAFGKDYAEQNLPIPVASKLENVGAILFAFVAIMGALSSGSFFVNFLQKKHTFGEPFELISAGTIPYSNLFIGIKVGAALFLVVIILSSFKYYYPKRRIDGKESD